MTKLYQTDVDRLHQELRPRYLRVSEINEGDGKRALLMLRDVVKLELKLFGRARKAYSEGRRLFKLPSLEPVRCIAHENGIEAINGRAA